MRSFANDGELNKNELPYGHELSQRLMNFRLCSMNCTLCVHYRIITIMKCRAFQFMQAMLAIHDELPVKQSVDNAL